MLEFIVSSKAGVFQRRAVPRVAHVELLMNRVSFAELTFDDDAEALSDLGADGARVRVLFDGSQIMHGPVVELRGSGPVGETTVEVWDDWFLFHLLGWPNPSAALTAQTSEYRRYSDDVETAVKLACTELSARLSLGWTVVPTTGLGSNVRVEFRFHPLADKFVPLLDADGLSWTITDGTVDVTEGDLFPRVLTLESGVIGDYEWSSRVPSATRVVVGGSGEGTARVFRGYTDAGRETTYGFIREVFKDSRMAEGITDLSPDADEVLAEGAPRVSLSADLQENSWFRFGTYKLGDRVSVSLPHVEVTDVISRVVFDDTPDNGLTVVPTVGLIDDSAEARQVRMIAALARGVRDAGRR